MKKASVSILKAHLSRYLDAVKSGEEVIVTERGRPVARLSGIDDAGVRTGRVARLVREGRLRPPTHETPPDSETARPRDPEGRSLQILVDERSEGR